MQVRRRYTLPLPGASPLALGERTLVMGVVNVTPDSFSDGGRWLDAGRAAEHALALEAAGADLLDVGGESTRPGADGVPVDEELRRVVPVLKRLAGQVRAPVSVDTCKAEVARGAIDAGAVIVNDVSGLRRDPALAGVVAASGAALLVMHSRGSSRDMYRDACYGDVGAEVVRELGASIAAAVGAGVDRARILVDPGLGFAKRAGQSYAALAALGGLAALDRPIVVGPSRKSFLAGPADLAPADRDWGTAAAVTAAILEGAHVVRVHRVREMRRVAEVADRCRGAHEARRQPGARAAAGAEPPAFSELPRSV